jgi:ferric-dicitrate binding protein FerR (iron transport regulator)
VSWQPPSEDWQSALQQPDDWQKQLRERGNASQTPVWRSPQPEPASAAPPAESVAAAPAEPASAPPPPAERPWQPAVSIDFRGSAPGAGAALALGVVGIGFWFLGPFAWYQGARARRAVRRSGGQLRGYGVASFGMVLGILETIGMVLITVLIVIGIVVTAGDTS